MQDEYILVLNTLSGGVSLIDPRDDSVVGAVPVGQTPRDLVVDNLKSGQYLPPVSPLSTVIDIPYKTLLDLPGLVGHDGKVISIWAKRGTGSLVKNKKGE